MSILIHSLKQMLAQPAKAVSDVEFSAFGL